MKFYLYTSIVIFILFSLFQTSCKENDVTPELLKAKKSLMISEPTEAQDSVTYLLSEFIKDFLSKSPKIKYYSELNNDKFLLLLDIPGISSRSLEHQESIIKVFPTVLELNEYLKSKEIFIGIYDKRRIAIVKNPDGEFYKNNAKQEQLMNYFD